MRSIQILKPAPSKVLFRQHQPYCLLFLTLELMKHVKCFEMAATIIYNSILLIQGGVIGHGQQFRATYASQGGSLARNTNR